MSAFVDSLNLRPQEKRLIVVVGVVAFVVLDLLFVQPHFSDYARMKYQLAQTLSSNQTFAAKIALDNNPNTGYKRQLEQLRKGNGDTTGAAFTGAIQLQTTVARKAQEAKVNVSEYTPVSVAHLGTNVASQFFESQSIRISVEGREEDLVNFLYNVGNDPAMIRVRELDFKPVEPNRYQLRGQITLTADYRKSDKTAGAKAVSAKIQLPPRNPAPAVAPAPRGPALPPTPPGNPRGPAAPGRRPSDAGRSSPGVAPPSFPPPVPRRPLNGQKPADAGNNP
jgi:hypothetical protein